MPAPLLAAYLFVAPALAGPSAPIACYTTSSGTPVYVCKIEPVAATTRFSLDNAPDGMVVQPRTGYLRWTPAPNQQGAVTVDLVRTTGADVRRDTYTFPATTPAAAPDGIYVSTLGRDNGAGTFADPLKSIHAAANRANPGDTIYVRGGRYFNDGYGTPFGSRPRDNFARIDRSGTSDAWITLRPFGNEYVALVSDVNGLAFRNARYWRVQGLELEGTAHALTTADSLALWWNTTAESNRIDGRGIALNGSYHVDIAHCLVHGFSGAGISNNDGAHVTVRDSVIYDNGWWTTAGTHGFANSKPRTDDNADPSSFKITMQRNLVFGNQSSMISHVFGNGRVKLEIDEGNGLHMQNTEGNFVGRFLVEQNLALYNGKAGLGLNTVDHGVIRNNAFYRNAQAVEDAAELTLQTSVSDAIAGNLFHALAPRRTIKDSSNAFAGLGANYAVPAADAATLPAQVLRVARVFADPGSGNFRRSDLVPAGFGPASDAHDAFRARQAEYGFVPAPAPTVIDAAYVQNLRTQIVASWPAPVPGDGIPDNLVLEDPVTGYCYRYEDRLDYPGPPSSGTTCGAKRDVVAPAMPVATADDEVEPATAIAAAPDASNALSLSQMADETPGATGMSCVRADGSTSANHWWRRFYFGEHPGVGAQAAVTGVTVATGANAAAGLPVAVNLYTIPHGNAIDTISVADLVPIGSGTGTTGGSLMPLAIAAAGTVADTAAFDLVVELRIDGAPDTFFAGANATAETHPTFVSAPACGILEPVRSADLGFADAHVVLRVGVDDGSDRIFRNGFESP